MLFEAAYWRPGSLRPAIELGLSRPDLAKWLTGFGRLGDLAVIAEQPDGERLGAAWFRFWNEQDHSYGFIASDIPELAIGVRADVRGQGVGTALLQALLSTAAQHSVSHASLSVELDNPARRLYERAGFRPVSDDGAAWTMIVQTAPGMPSWPKR